MVMKNDGGSSSVKLMSRPATIRGRVRPKARPKARPKRRPRAGR